MKEIFEENIGLLIHDVARLLRVLYDRQMASIRLARSQWWLLTYLFFKDGINQSELAILMDMEKAPLSRLLDRMEKKGWVIRKNENKDRRTKNIYLSESIKPLISYMRDKAAEYRSESLSILTDKALLFNLKPLHTSQSLSDKYFSSSYCTHHLSVSEYFLSIKFIIPS